MEETPNWSTESRETPKESTDPKETPKRSTDTKSTPKECLVLAKAKKVGNCSWGSFTEVAKLLSLRTLGSGLLRRST